MATSIPQVTGWRASVKRLRRCGRSLLNQALVHVSGTPVAKRQPLTGTTRHILVVRLNKRLGNILFLTPMLHALHQGLPTCAIDILIRDENQVPLLANLPSVRHVYVQPTTLRTTASMLHRLRRQHYDLVIDPSTNSTGNRIGLLLTRGRQRLGFADSSQWLRLTHAAAPPVSSHQAQRGMELLHGGIAGSDFGAWPHLLVHPSANAQSVAAGHWQRLFGTSTAPVIGFFTRATGAKQLDNAWWQTWLAAMRQQTPHARLLQIQPPGDDTCLTPDVATIQIAALDELAALLGRLAIFVAADSGPMHLAAASGAATVGLFKVTSPLSYAPLGPQCCAIRQAATQPEHVAEVVATRLPA